MKRLTLIMLIALAGCATALTGCNLITGSDESATEGESLPEAPSELNLTYGGYEPTNEEPGFGDPTILDDFSEADENAVDDRFAGDPEVRRMEELPETDVYVVRIVWGHLNEEGKSQVDWSGSAGVINGAMIVRKAILFEPGDFIHRPREDRRNVEWTSYTDAHMDGIALVILDPQTMPTTDDAVVNQFTFETGPCTHTFEIHEMANLDTLITVDDDGNAVHFTSFLREPGGCQEGFMRGQWIHHGRDWGEFRGGWISLDGELMGHIRGMWGRSIDGDNVVYGKYISADGTFEGLLKGTFGSQPTGRPSGAIGWFRGRWYDENDEARGVFGGHWNQARSRGRHGYLRGMWGQQCPRFEDAVGYTE